MKFKIGDTVDYKYFNCNFKSCTVVGYNKSINYYIIQIPEKYDCGWTSEEDDEKPYGVKAGTERCWCTRKSSITLSKPSKKSVEIKAKHEKLIAKKIIKLIKEAYEIS